MPIARKAQFLTLAAATLWLGGCAVGPDYQRPDAPKVDRFTTQPLPAATVIGQGAGRRRSTLPARARRAGTLVDHLRQRRAEPPRTYGAGTQPVDRVGPGRAAPGTGKCAMPHAAGCFPSADASAGATRAEAVARLTSATPGPFTLYNASVSVSYTLDLFGGVRRGIEAQLAQRDYQQAQLDSTYLTLAGNVVTASLQEASLREQIRATEQIVRLAAQDAGHRREAAADRCQVAVRHAGRAFAAGHDRSDPAAVARPARHAPATSWPPTSAPPRRSWTPRR